MSEEYKVTKPQVSACVKLVPAHLGLQELLAKGSVCAEEEHVEVRIKIISIWVGLQLELEIQTAAARGDSGTPADYSSHVQFYLEWGENCTSQVRSQVTGMPTGAILIAVGLTIL